MAVPTTLHIGRPCMRCTPSRIRGPGGGRPVAVPWVGQGGGRGEGAARFPRGGRLARGDEATDIGLAYAPVSQAHGHNHIVQCFSRCTAAQTSSVPHQVVADCALALVICTLRSAGWGGGGCGGRSRAPCSAAGCRGQGLHLVPSVLGGGTPTTCAHACAGWGDWAATPAHFSTGGGGGGRRASAAYPRPITNRGAMCCVTAAPGGGGGGLESSSSVHHSTPGLGGEGGEGGGLWRPQL